MMRDSLAILGLCMVGFGLWLWSEPVSLVVVGGVLIYVGVSLNDSKPTS